MAPSRGVMRLPEWVPHSLMVVQATERFVIEARSVTTTPQLLGSWAALAWVGGDMAEGLHEAPGTNERVWPSRAQARLEMAVAASLGEGLPYPSPEWWAAAQEIAPGLGDRLGEMWWHGRVGHRDAHAFNYGAMVALLWLIDPDAVTPVMFAPFEWSDGSEIPAPRRALAGEHLAAMWAAAASEPCGEPSASEPARG